MIYVSNRFGISLTASWHLHYHSFRDLPITHQQQQLSQLSVTAVPCARAAQKQEQNVVNSNAIRSE